MGLPWGYLSSVPLNSFELCLGGFQPFPSSRVVRFEYARAINSAILNNCGLVFTDLSGPGCGAEGDA